MSHVRKFKDHATLTDAANRFATASDRAWNIAVDAAATLSIWECTVWSDWYLPGSNGQSGRLLKRTDYRKFGRYWIIILSSDS